MTILAALLLSVFAVPGRAQAPAASDLAASPEYQALVAKQNAELAALEQKDEAELLEKLKNPKFDKKAAEKLIKKHAAAQGEAASKEVRDEETYLREHALKPVEPAKEKK